MRLCVSVCVVTERERERMLNAHSPILLLSPPIRCLSADGITTTSSSSSSGSSKKEEEDEEKMVLSMMKRALMVISETFRGGEREEEEEREAVSRLGEFVKRRHSKGVSLGFKVSFLLDKTQETLRRRIPSAKNLLRLKCLEEDAGETLSSEEGTKMLFLEWQSAFYERLWMEERSKNAKRETSSSSKSDERSVVGVATSPDGPLLREGYARTPSTAGKTSATMSSVEEEEEEEEEEEDKCDYREWNAITRSPILKIQAAAARSNRNSEDNSHLALPISNLLQTLILEEEGEGEEEREEGVVTPRPTIVDKNNFGDENVQFAFRTPEQSSKNKKDPQCLTPPGAPLRVRNSFRRVSEEKSVARFGAWTRNSGGRPPSLEEEEDEEEQAATRRSLF